MPEYAALYYPSWDPPVAWLRAMLLFYDKIHVILPKGIKPDYDEANARVIDLISGAFDPIVKNQYEIDYEKYDIELIKRAIDYIADNNNYALNSANVSMDSNLQLYSECTMTHRSKFSDKIFQHLIDRNLCFPELEKNGLYPVDRQASGLILSLLADNYAFQRGIRSVTERSLCYTANSLNSYKANKGTTLGYLASAVMRLEIPANMSDISPEEYVEYRKLFSSIREPFHKALDELYNDNLLEGISKPKVLEDRINDVTKDFCKEIDKIRKSKTCKKVRKWTPVFMGTLATICILMPEPLTKVLGSGVAFLVSTFNTLKPEEHVTNASYTQRILANLDNYSISESMIKKLK